MSNMFDIASWGLRHWNSPIWHRRCDSDDSRILRELKERNLKPRSTQEHQQTFRTCNCRRQRTIKKSERNREEVLSFVMF
jgi:hypothetical protein